MVFLVDRYVEWVRSNEAFALALERMSRGLSMFLINPDSLVSMESAWTLTKVHAFSNQVILSTANRSPTQREKWSWLLELIKEVECLAEIALRHLKNHRAGWLFVIAVELGKGIVRGMIHKGRFTEAVVVVKGLLLGLKRVKRPQGSSAAEGTQRPVVSSDLVIPRVIARGASIESISSRTTWADTFAVIIDTYLILRPIAMATLAFRRFSPSRLHMKQTFFHEEVSSKTPAAVRAVMALRRSLSPEWSLWRSFFVLDVASLVIATVVRKQRAPVLVIDQDNGTVRPASDAFCGDTDPAAWDGCSSEETAEDVRITTLKNAIFYSLFREPFFTVILKDMILRHFVDGVFNRWIPILGPLLANQVRYMLSMQECSYLYTLSSGAA
mmetsp:Transcript_47800/g.55284  ORF Transcript_47800/g.55284 Transcript_47800/m.55284 type:complete len:384 (-) Transcript_47800:73-1224(-)